MQIPATAKHYNIPSSVQQQILRAREERQHALDTLLLHSDPVVFISLSIPGPEKWITGAEYLFRWGLAKILQSIPAEGLPETTGDILGPYALFRTTISAKDAKHAAVAIEERFPAARLLDIDIYHSDTQIDRHSLGLPQRRCLLCDSAAKECILTGRHDHNELIQAAHDLLATYRS